MSHRHFSIDFPPRFCEQCGKRWAVVVDGRLGRRMRRKQARRGEQVVGIITKRGWRRVA